MTHLMTGEFFIHQNFPTLATGFSGAGASTSGVALWIGVKASNVVAGVQQGWLVRWVVVGSLSRWQGRLNHPFEKNMLKMDHFPK